MKKTLFFIVTLMFLFQPMLIARNAYNKGEKVGQVGIGVGGLGGFYGSSSLPIIGVGFEVGIEKNISVGGVAAYSASTVDYPFVFLNTNRSYKWKYTYLTIAGRGSYHFLQNNDKFDVYAGAGLGYNIVSTKFDGDPTIRVGAANASGSYLFFGVHGGGRYYFSPNFAAYAELGYGFGILNAGISMKF